MVLRLLVVLALSLAGCAPARSPTVASGRFLGSDGATHELVAANARFTVVEFFSAHCPAQAKHDPRLIELAQRYRAQGVAFYAIDSEHDASLDRARAEAARRGYPFVILLDPEASAARSLRADYATYSVLLDRQARVLFRGGIDSDRNYLTPNRTPYLEQAIQEALADRPISRPEAKTLGCSLAFK
jgi:thiol-disulfide isomerase/thioredoxin